MSGQILLPENVTLILSALRDKGFEAYAVGGSVRDWLLGRQPEDWDITTNALPEEIKSIFKRTVDTGIQHGTVTVLLKDQSGHPEGFEVTTYRIDGKYSDGRHPDRVEFTSSLEEDLSRRDFTINAMAAGLSGNVTDLFGGMEDLSKKRIRAVGDPEKRFSEDALRMLRAVRFSAQLSFEIEKETLDAIKKKAFLLEKVSKERIAAELGKILISPNPSFIDLLFSLNLAPFITEDFEKIFLPTSLSEDLPEKKYVRYSVLLKNNDFHRKLLRDLKLDNRIISDTDRLIRLLKERPLFKETGEGDFLLRKYMSEYGEIFSDWLDTEELLKEYPCDVKRIRERAEEIKRSGDCLSMADLKIRGGDLLSMGITGPRVGEILNELFDEVLMDPKMNDRERLLEKCLRKIKQ